MTRADLAEAVCRKVGLSRTESAELVETVLEEICASGVNVDGLSLFGDVGGRSPMRLIGRYRLGAEA